MDQILAVVEVRLRILANTLRRRTTGWEKLAGFLTLGIGGLFAGGVAFGVAAMTWYFGSSDDPSQVRFGLLACFWVSALVGVVMPLVLSSGASGLDTTNLTSFPISKAKLFLLNWSSSFASADHFAHYPTLVATFVVWLRLGFDGGWSALLLFVLLPIVVVTWSSAFLMLLQSLMRHRRGKEIAGMVGFAIFLVLVLLPSLLQPHLDPPRTVVFTNQPGGEVEVDEPSDEEELAKLVEPVIQPLLRVASWLPPNIAADGIAGLHVPAGTGEAKSSRHPIVELLGWWIAGLGFAWLVFRRQLGSVGATGRSGSGGTGKTRVSTFDATRTFGFLPQEVVAVASKELLYIGRSSVGRLNILIVPAVSALMLVVFQPLSDGEVFLGRGVEDWALIGLMLYGVLFTNNFVNNSAGWEGVGFKTYLLAPVPFERVLFGKNLGVWLYSLVLFALVLITWTVFRGVPPLSTFATGTTFYFGAIVLFTTSGNFSSLAFPVARDISKMKSQPSQPAILMSLATVFGLAGLLLFLLGVPALLGFALSPAIPLSAFLVGTVVVYRLSLPIAANLFRRKRDRILERLEQGS